MLLFVKDYFLLFFCELILHAHPRDIFLAGSGSGAVEMQLFPEITENQGRCDKYHCDRLYN